MDSLDALFAANADIVSPDREAVIGTVQPGGVNMNPGAQSAPAPVQAAPVAPAAPAAPVVREVIQLGPREAEATQDAPAATQPDPAQAVQPEPTHVPLPVYVEQRQQWQAARDRLAQAEAVIQQHQQAWQAAQADLQFAAATRAEMPRWQGIEAKALEAQQKAELLTARQQVSDAAWEHGLGAGLTTEAAKAHVQASVAAWDRDYKQQQLLQQIAADQQKTQLLVAEQFKQRDQSWAQQQQEAETKAWVDKTNGAFVSEFDALARTIPSIATNQPLKKLVYEEWIGNIQRNQGVPVAQVAKPYLEAIRAQVVTVQAPQQTRAEVHSQMVRTTGGGSGATATPAARPSHVPGSGIAGAIARYRQTIAAR